MNQILLKSRIGTNSQYGEVFESCYPVLCDDTREHCQCVKNSFLSLTLAVKKVPLYDESVPLLDASRDHITSYIFTRHEIYAEIVAMQLCGFLIQANVCPNLPMLYSYYPCDECDFENVNITHRLTEAKWERTGKEGPAVTTDRCILMVTDYAAGGDVKTWFSKQDRDLEDWLNVFFQIFMGIAAIQRYYNMTHYDLHWGNVLVYEMKEIGGVWRYQLDGRFYDCPNRGYYVTLWDFGMATIPGQLEAEGANVQLSRERCIEKDPKKPQVPLYACDYKLISELPIWIKNNKKVNRLVPEYMLTTFRQWVYRFDPIETLIHNLYAERYSISIFPPDILDMFSLDKDISDEVPREYHKYLNPKMRQAAMLDRYGLVPSSSSGGRGGEKSLSRSFSMTPRTPLEHGSKTPTAAAAAAAHLKLMKRRGLILPSGLITTTITTTTTTTTPKKKSSSSMKRKRRVGVVYREAPPGIPVSVGRGGGMRSGGGGAAASSSSSAISGPDENWGARVRAQIEAMNKVGGGIGAPILLPPGGGGGGGGSTLVRKSPVASTKRGGSGGGGGGSSQETLVRSANRPRSRSTYYNNNPGGPTSVFLPISEAPESKGKGKGKGKGKASKKSSPSSSPKFKGGSPSTDFAHLGLYSPKPKTNFLTKTKRQSRDGGG